MSMPVYDCVYVCISVRAWALVVYVVVHKCVDLDTCIH